MTYEKETQGRASAPPTPPEKQDAVYRPLDMAMAQRTGSDRRTSLTEKTTPLRQSYLNELKQDLDEITGEIIKKETLNEILSLLTTKYAIERNILAEERTLMAEERSIMAEKRTRASMERTEMAENRSGLARLRTQLGQRNVFLAEKRSLMAQQRTFLAKARTELAFIRTGVALVALASGLMRYFGLGWWTAIDGSILALGIMMVITGVYYYLPTRKQEGGLLDAIREKEEALLHRKPRIMVVDDDVEVCNSLKIYLGKKEWQAEAFTSPFVARQRLEATPFDVVITDFMMEGMTGVEFLHHVQRLSPGTPVILISRMETLEEFVKEIKGDIFDSFSKPVDAQKLKASVKRALEDRMMIYPP